MKRCLYTFWCMMGMLLPIVSFGQLSADFTASTMNGCSPILVQFTDQSSGSPSSWFWDLGNGTTSTVQNPSTTYIIPGTYTVKLTVSDGSISNTKTSTNFITVNPSPVVAFVASDTSVTCLPTTIQFTDQSVLGSAGTATYLWDFGDGSTSTLQNPSHTYNTVGNYNVTLHVTNSNGCSRLLTKNQYIQVTTQPVAGFTAANPNSCAAPHTVNFSNSSTGATSWLWDFGNGSTSTAANPSYTYTTPGTYTVRLVVYNNAGCTDTLIRTNYVSAGTLDAAFTKSATTICTGQSISFTNTSVPGPGTSTWYFGDGTSSTATNPTKIYNTPGTYTVKLKVVFSGNCADSTTQTVTVQAGPDAQFTASPTNGCTAPFTTQFSNTTTGATSYLWLFGDGTTSTAANPSKTYTALGTYTVKLIAYNASGCTDTLTRTNYIKVANPVMTVSTTTNSHCAPASIQFNANVPAGVTVTSYTWNFGDGTIVAGGPSMSHVYPNAGSYTVTVNFSTGPGCNFTSSPLHVAVGTKPSASFTAAPNPVCPGQPVTFTNTSTGPTGTTWLWTFGDGSSSSTFSPVKSYAAEGTYTVRLIATNNGCKDTFQTTVVVHPPKANYTFSYDCSNRLKVSFNNTSVGGTVFSWNFGDGNSSTATNPTHIYNTYGTYPVTLTATNTLTGCVSTKTDTIRLYQVLANFWASDTLACKGETIQFTAATNGASLPFVQNVSWYWGDGTSTLATGWTASHAYSATGTYTVKIVVKDNRNCTDTFTRTNYITVAGPTVDFTATPVTGCSPLGVQFTDNSTSGPLSIVSREWTFGDGTANTTTGATVSHTYATGTYHVKLKVTDANGCTATLTKSNYIKANKPNAAFATADTIRCPGQPVQFTNTSTGAGLSYQWNFGDGNTSTTAAPTHAYTSSGNYNVRLIVTDNTGCKDTLLRPAYIKVTPVSLSFSASDTFATCPPLAVTFTNTSANGGNYQWDFDNGNTSILTSPTTVFTLPGTYNVRLIGQSASGCVDTVTKTITILGPNGTLSYTPTNGCLPMTVQFNSTNVNTTTLVWDMNNGVTQTTTGSATTYTYTQPGIYVPKLLLSDGASCTVPIEGADTIRVDQVVADFDFTPASICDNGTVQFTDTVLSSINPVTTRSWSFGDGGTSSAHNPSHYYAAPGSYTVSLVTGTAFGCTDTIVKTVEILAAPVVSGGPAQSICQGSATPVQLQATGASSYSWSPATGLSATNIANPTALPATTTTYTVIGISANGCSDTATVTVTVNPIPTIVTGPDPQICEGDSVQLTTSGAATYSWSPITDLSCTNCPNPVASPTTTTTYTVTGTSTAGCSATASVTVNVNSLPEVAVNAVDTAICAGGSTQLTAAGADTYDWFPATGLSCSTCPNPVASPATTTTYIVTGTNTNGCVDTAMITIVVHPLPQVSAGTDQNLCLGQTTQLNATGAVNYTWSPATGLSCTTCPNPTVTITSTTTYTVTGVDANGCEASDQVTVTVNGLPTLSISNDTTVCAGTPVQLQAGGAQTYSWSPATGLSSVISANPVATLSSTTTYTVVGTNAAGCTDTATITVTVNPLPQVDAGKDQLVCSLGSVQLQATGAIQYSWSPASGLSAVNIANPVATPSAPATYTVTGIDANGCSNTDQVTVGFHQQPVVDAGVDQTICEGVPVQLAATGAMAYSWSPATGLSCTSCPDPLANPSQTTVYTVVGTDINGCSDSDQVVVNVIEMQPIIVGPGDTICKGESVQLTASGGNEYFWYPSEGLSATDIANPVATPESTIKYYVVVKQGNCFLDTQVVNVVVHPQPSVYAGADQRSLAGTPVNLFADAKYTDSYSWSPSEGLSCTDCQTAVAMPKKTTTYTVKVSNAFGCTAQDDVTVFVECDNSQVFMANTFTPNGDGNNDRYYPQGKGLSIVNRFRIFNRWGELMFDAQNIPANQESYGWDGTYKGEQLKPDVYVYILDALCETGEPLQVKGDVSIFR